MAFRLKVYQQRCLDELAGYLRRTWELQDAGSAFYEQTHRTYHHVESLRGLPYVCVRVPTGGGKTVLAAYSVGIAAENLLRADRCLVLWLAPTTPIVGQTLKALHEKRHPYRGALDDAFDGCVTVMDLKSALSLQRGTLESDTVISANMVYKSNAIDFVFGPSGTTFNQPMELKVFWDALEDLDDYTLYGEGRSKLEPEICEWGLIYRIPHFSLYYYRRR